MILIGTIVFFAPPESLPDHGSLYLIILGLVAKPAGPVPDGRRDDT